MCVFQVENMKHITRKWADDSEVTHCTACGKLFTVTVRKVSIFYNKTLYYN